MESCFRTSVEHYEALKARRAALILIVDVALESTLKFLEVVLRLNKLLRRHLGEAPHRNTLLSLKG